jgi:hypothetical protein
MKQKQAAIFLAFSICVYALLLALAVFRIADSRSKAIKSSRSDFSTLASLVKSSLDQGKSYTSKIFLEQMRTRYSLDPGLLCLSLSEPSGSLAYAIPASSMLTAPSQGAAGKPTFLSGFFSSLKSANVTSMKATIAGPDGLPLALQAVYTAISTKAVFDALRDSLIGALAMLFIAAIVLLVVSLGDDEEAVPESRAETAAGSSAETESYSGIPAHPLSSEDDFEIPAFSIDDSPAYERPLPVKDLLPPIDDILPAPESMETGSEDPPSGLFSPRSGLGWESYLPERLEAELSRSASLELDCSLLLIRLPGMVAEGTQYRNLAGAIVEFFTFKDIAFERGEEEFAVILPGKSIEQALSAAREFLKLAPEGSRVGISSRTGRRVNSATILEEASSALEKAGTGPESPIVGFKADPERYRNFKAGIL